LSVKNHNKNVRPSLNVNAMQINQIRLNATKLFQKSQTIIGDREERKEEHRESTAPETLY